MASKSHRVYTEYLLHIRNKLWTSKFQKYVAIPGKANDELTMDHAQLRQWCVSLCDIYHQKALLNCIGDIETFLDRILALPMLDVRSLADATSPVSAERSAVSFRLDVDGGIWSMAPLATALARRAIPGWFFLLHTAAYYGIFSPKGVFVRQPGFPPYLADLVATGQEIGIHNDTLKVFALGIDGVGALRSEIRWLRRHGASVGASAAHNSAPVFGAENFEIFKGLCLAERTQLKLGERMIALGAVSAQALGLMFEANHALVEAGTDAKALSAYLDLRVDDPIRNPVWLRHHFLENPVFASAYETDIWLTGNNAWFIACRRDKRLEFPVTHEGVVEYLERSKSERIVINIHPDYVVL